MSPDDNLKVQRSTRGRTRKPIHPGQVLYEDVIKPKGISIESAALQIGIPFTKLSRILLCRKSMSKSDCSKVATWTDTSVESWKDMQDKHDFFDVNVSQSLPLQ